MRIKPAHTALLIAAGAAALGFGAQAISQTDETNAAAVPSCTATMTDHCINRHGHPLNHYPAHKAMAPMASPTPMASDMPMASPTPMASPMPMATDTPMPMASPSPTPSPM